MQNATYFIEVISSCDRNKVINSRPLPISQLDQALKSTSALDSLKTIAVWKIKEHPPVDIAKYENELRATVVENL